MNILIWKWHVRVNRYTRYRNRPLTNVYCRTPVFIPLFRVRPSTLIQGVFLTEVMLTLPMRVANGNHTTIGLYRPIAYLKLSALRCVCR